MKDGPVHLRPQRLVYVRATGPYEASMPKAWSKLLGWVDKKGFSSLVTSWYGIARDNPAKVGGDQCRYDACVPVDPFFEDRALRELGLTALPSGPYARHKHRSGCGDAVDRLCAFYASRNSEIGPQFDLKRPIVTIYFDDPRKFRHDLRAEVCVPIASTGISGRRRDAA